MSISELEQQAKDMAGEAKDKLNDAKNDVEHKWDDATDQHNLDHHLAEDHQRETDLDDSSTKGGEVSRENDDDDSLDNDDRSNPYNPDYAHLDANTLEAKIKQSLNFD